MCHIITVFYAFYNILKSLDFMRGMSLQSNLSEHVLRALYELNFGFPLLRPACVIFISEQ